MSLRNRVYNNTGLVSDPDQCLDNRFDTEKAGTLFKSIYTISNGWTFCRICHKSGFASSCSNSWACACRPHSIKSCQRHSTCSRFKHLFFPNRSMMYFSRSTHTILVLYRRVPRASRVLQHTNRYIPSSHRSIQNRCHRRAGNKNIHFHLIFLFCFLTNQWLNIYGED